MAEPRSLPKRLHFAAFLYASYFRYVITAQARSDDQATRRKIVSQSVRYRKSTHKSRSRIVTQNTVG